MLIEVVTDEFTASQMRAYAEYRFFAVLVPHAQLIRRVKVVLRRVAGALTCHADVVLEDFENVRARATRRHPYGAIERAAERTGQLVRRRLAADVKAALDQRTGQER